jgi:hypothetical protein
LTLYHKYKHPGQIEKIMGDNKKAFSRKWSDTNEVTNLGC